MPKSKRSKVVSLTKVAKKTREDKTALLQKLQENAEKWDYCWVFEVGAMRNTHLQTVRKLWKGDARIFFGRTALMAKALGTTPEEEQQPGLHQLARHMKGQVGLLFTNTTPKETVDWFLDFQQPEFARTGNVASKTVTLPVGPIMRQYSDEPEPFPHNEEPQLRKLGLTTYLDKGVPSLRTPHKICDAGKVLTAEQAQLLKLIGIRMVYFKVGLIARWDKASGSITVLNGDRIQKIGKDKKKPRKSSEETEGNGEANGDDEDDAEMSE